MHNSQPPMVAEGPATPTNEHSTVQLENNDVSLRSYAESTSSTLVPSSIVAHDRGETNSIAPTDDASIHSRSRLVRRFSSSLSAARERGNSSTDNEQQQRRRATLAYLHDLRGSRAPSQDLKKTTSRKAFEVICEVVDWMVPIDVDDGKTSMRQSSLGHLFRIGDGEGEGANEGGRRVNKDQV